MASSRSTIPDAAPPQADTHRRAPEGVTPIPPMGEPRGNGRQAPGQVPVLDRSRQLPSHRGKLTRIQDSAQGAVLALREWVDLRVDLVKAEIEEMIAEKQEQAKFGAIMGVFAALAALFLLLTLGFGFAAGFEGLLGWAQLSALTAGFGLVFLILALIAAVTYLRSPFSGD